MCIGCRVQVDCANLTVHTQLGGLHALPRPAPPGPAPPVSFCLFPTTPSHSGSRNTPLLGPFLTTCCWEGHPGQASAPLHTWPSRGEGGTGYRERPRPLPSQRPYHSPPLEAGPDVYHQLNKHHDLQHYRRYIFFVLSAKLFYSRRITCENRFIQYLHLLCRLLTFATRSQYYVVRHATSPAALWQGAGTRTG